MCIYLEDNGDLTYKKQEHIFPAGLGGIQMLDHGVVSDQANELFSPLELKLQRESLISIDRMFYGPGKRGSHKPEKASKSVINVGLQDDGKPILCYTAAGKPYNIPQMYRNDKEVIVSLPDKEHIIEEQMELFLSNLKKFNGKYVFLKSEYISSNSFLIGCFEGKYYVVTNSERPDASCINSEIKCFIEHFKTKEIKRGTNHTKQSHKAEECPKVARMYAKVAINTLAYLKGLEYVQHRNFDEIKKWIVTGESDTDFFFLPDIKSDSLGCISQIIPEKSHWCILVSNNGNLDAVVCFYNQYIRRFTLGKLPAEKRFFPDGFICDWQNKKEYKLIQLVDRVARKNHEQL